MQENCAPLQFLAFNISWLGKLVIVLDAMPWDMSRGAGRGPLYVSAFCGTGLRFGKCPPLRAIAVVIRAWSHGHDVGSTPTVEKVHSKVNRHIIHGQPGQTDSTEENG